MSIRPHVRGLSVAACVAVLAGCGSSSGGSSATSSGTAAPATHSTSAAPTTTASASPTSNSTAAGAPGVPEPARQHTTAGAIAFAKYYVKKVNDTGLHPKTGVLEPLAAPSCKTCKNLSRSVRNLAKSKEHYSTEVESVHSSHRIIGEDGMVIEVIASQPKVTVLDQSGSSIRSVPATKKTGLVFFLDWAKAGWRIHEIKIDESVGS